MNAATSLLMLLRRELWEHRGVVIAPAVIAILTTLLMLTGLFRGLSGNVSQIQIVQGLSMMPPAQREGALAALLASVTPLFLVAMLVLIVFYAADALYAERRDRSILFWKSLPVTDLATVMSKLLTAAVVIPLVTAILIILTHLVTLLLATIMVWGANGDAWALVWQPAPLLRLWVLMIYALLAVMLWYLPFLGWLLLASAWARKAPLLWAVLPVVVVGQLEILALGTSRVYRLIGDRVIGVFGAGFRRDLGQLVQFDGDSGSVRAQTDLAGERLLSYIDLPGLLTAPGFWGGIVVAAVFVTLAVVLRRFRDEA
ncbi:MAG: hypothetical protein JJU27_03245 [Gammaproteobacteria bacterium]|nr:hypothetical protein [Gammaproteobacteria bacterium]